MIKFKPVYKNEYNKIAIDYERDKNKDGATVISTNNNSYIFKSNIRNTSAYTVVSNRSRNENDRFKNNLVSTK